MAVSYKQRQEEQVRPPPTHPTFFQPVLPGPIRFQRGGGGVRGSDAPSGKAVSGSSAGGRGIKCSG